MPQVILAQYGYGTYRNSTVENLKQSKRTLEKEVADLTTILDSLRIENSGGIKENSVLSDSIYVLREVAEVKNDSITKLNTIISEHKQPRFSQEWIEDIRQYAVWGYVYLLMPICSILILVILIYYSYQNLFGRNKPDDRYKLIRRISAFTLPFLISTYIVWTYYFQNINFEVDPSWNLLYEGDIYFLGGLFLGFLFLLFIQKISIDDELQVSLVLLYASTVLFSIATAFIVIDSMPMINVIFGFLIGAVIYVLSFGFKRKVSEVTPE